MHISLVVLQVNVLVLHYFDSDITPWRRVTMGIILQFTRSEGRVTLENVFSFKYLGSLFTADDDQIKDIRTKIIITTTRWDKLRNIFSSPKSICDLNWDSMKPQWSQSWPTEVSRGTWVPRLVTNLTGPTAACYRGLPTKLSRPRLVLLRQASI